MKAAGKDAASFARKPKPGIWAALIFGDDDGVVSDLSNALIHAWTKGTEADIQSLDEDEIRKDKASLFDALEARSLLGDTRIVKVRTRGDKIGPTLLDAINEGDNAPDRFGGRLVILADALQKKSKLRSGVENAASAMALQTYTDSAGDMTTLIEAELAKDSVSITPDAAALLAASLPGHRALARAEIEKFALYGLGRGTPITADDVQALSAAGVDHAVSALVTATLSGHLQSALTELDRLEASGANAITVLRAFDRELSRMLSARDLMKSSSGDVGMKLRPPVWRSEWPAFTARLKPWSVKRLRAALDRLYDAELGAKTAGPTASPALRVLIRSFAQVAG
ncbi:MAG: DNA polymerase III subunit delta [Pseudomonadota bacterium]